MSEAVSPFEELPRGNQHTGAEQDGAGMTEFEALDQARAKIKMHSHHSVI